MSAATQNEMERLKKERDSAIEQVAYWRERAVTAEGREQALAAHVEALHDFLKIAPIGSGICCCGADIATHADPMSCGHSPVDEVEYHAGLLLEQAPETSLARLKAEWQAEALESLADDAYPHIRIWLKDEAKKLRRQARGGEHEHSN